MKKISLIMLAILCLATVASAATVTISTTMTNASGLGGNSYKCVNMGDGSQTESQAPFTRGSGKAVSNGTLLAPGVDGCHIYNGGSVNIRWSDVGEDATTKKSGTGAGSMYGNWVNAGDKVMQVNSGGGCTVNSSGSTFQTYQRQNGGTGYTCQMSIGGSVSGGNKGCVSCAPSTTCSVSGSIGVKCCRCFKP